MIYCEDCRHLVLSSGRTGIKALEYAKCAKTARETNDSPVARVFAEGEPLMEYCSTARMRGQPCGPDAKLFELKPAPVAQEGGAA